MLFFNLVKRFILVYKLTINLFTFQVLFIFFKESIKLLLDGIIIIIYYIIMIIKYGLFK